MYRARTLSPVHQPVDYDGPLRTAEEDVRQWRQYIGRLQGKLVPGASRLPLYLSGSHLSKGLTLWPFRARR